MSEGAAPAAGAGAAAGAGGVARWSLGLEQLLADPAGAAAFAHFLAKEFAAENIRFWWSCEQYRCCEDEARRAALAREIYQRHLAEGAPEPVNVDAGARRAAAPRLAPPPPPRDLFAPAQKQIFNVMKFDSYPRFLRSAVHAECARADLRGLPPPHAAPLPPAPASTPAPAPAPDTPKLKKSASNASERRRSGSLLPWKGRTSSRDRTVSTTSNNEDHNMTDVVKAGALCRVVLPDGATSVVSVDARATVPTVRALVERLLQRRNLLCSDFDVVLKDGEQGGSGGASVDASLPASALGGRCVAVERRCVVRVALGARCVAVRARPARRLRHVLRPVLRRCGGPARHAVLLAGAPVHPDTLLQDLDGMRVQVVEVAGAAGEPRDDDADSLSDVALRHDDDDAQSARRSSASSASSAGEAARVRAALRPGAPLHHPPDFLENLRETQRARLPPRTPPPLPPKPARAAPAVV